MICISKSIGTQWCVIGHRSKEVRFVHSPFPDQAFSMSQDGTVGSNRVSEAGLGPLRITERKLRHL